MSESRNHEIKRDESDRSKLPERSGTTKRLLKKKITPAIPIPTDSERGFPLIHVVEYFSTFSDLIIPQSTKDTLEHIISENRAAITLSEYGLKPRQKLLFCGPPGTGKTLASYVISSAIGLPHVYVRFDSILSSYLGETATNLRKIFDFIERGKWVVLFDEFDIIGKKRDDPYEHGEIKRIVNNFMQMLDNYEGQSIIIAATNHPQLLDSAIWRRFDEIVLFDLPDLRRRELLLEKYLRILRREKDINLKLFARRTIGFSAAEIAQICEDALRRAIISGRNKIYLEDLSWSVREQKRRKKIIQ